MVVCFCYYFLQFLLVCFGRVLLFGGGVFVCLVCKDSYDLIACSSYLFSYIFNKSKPRTGKPNHQTTTTISFKSNQTNHMTHQNKANQHQREHILTTTHKQTTHRLPRKEHPPTKTTTIASTQYKTTKAPKNNNASNDSNNKQQTKHMKHQNKPNQQQREHIISTTSKQHTHNNTPQTHTTKTTASTQYHTTKTPNNNTASNNNNSKTNKTYETSKHIKPTTTHINNKQTTHA